MNKSVITIFLNGGFQYDAGNVFLHMLADELDKFVQVFRVDLRQSEDKIIEAMNTAIQIKSSCFIAYNAILAELKYGQEQSLYDGTNIPMLAWLVDNPLHHRIRLETAGARVLVGCVDKNHVDLVGRITSKGLSSFFCPHFACLSQDAVEPVEYKTDGSALRVIFPGSLGVPAATRVEAIITKNALSKELFHSLTLATESNAGLDIYAAAIECLQSLNIRLAATDMANFLTNTILPIDGYIRAKRREEMLTAMRNVGICVDVYGNAPDNHPALERHRYHGPVGFRQLLNVIAAADVLLDTGANFSNGTHERVLTGIGLGKMVVTPKNLLWSQYFADSTAVKMYHPHESQAVAEWLAAINTNKAQNKLDVDDRARQIVMENFTVANTAQSIIDVLSFGV